MTTTDAAKPPWARRTAAERAAERDAHAKALAGELACKALDLFKHLQRQVKHLMAHRPSPVLVQDLEAAATELLQQIKGGKQ